ncbi:terpene synthase [Choiromyces venosus 120613-1]|uniref:Terpene cyclase/mutase family member n=1 Tax=Choiromyces venosus 120613-1 TaxID=1336337 RepID=A0A3N4JYY9_9PEZI|nr:terpene synthase [Choiromyces venosus 120613-1]
MSGTTVTGNLPTTELTRWRLKTEDGRQTWHYLKTDEEVAAWPQSTADKYHLGLPTGLPTLPTPGTPLDAARNGLSFFSKLQLSEGQWACEYGGPMFLLPINMIAYFVTNSEIPEEWRIEIQRYLAARAHPEDGGWGLHIEGESTVFGTALNYVVLRIVGMSPDHPVCVKARKTLHALGGALQSPLWGKVMLSLMGCYKWEGVNPVPPELWLLPNWVPFHPWRWWVHNRQVFLAMSYLYSLNKTRPVDDLTIALRKELYVESYDSIDFSLHRNTVAPKDIYHPHTKVLDTLNEILTVWGKWICPNKLQEIARNHVYKLIKLEDENSDYCCLGPVNNPMNLVARYFTEGECHAVNMHRETIKDFLWMTNEGMLANGTDGVQCWDTSFLIQSVLECGFGEDPQYRHMLIKALQFLDTQQIREEPKEKEFSYRQQRKGAWPFSKRAQGYTVSDTTAEGLKSVLLLQSVPGMPKLISDERLEDNVDVLLTMQNANGGFASYELIRAGPWLESLNAAEVFGRIMVEYPYPECSTAVIMGLQQFIKTYPNHPRRTKIENVVRRTVQYIKKAQEPDGSWYGSWGICFTYATMFATEALKSTGETYDNSPTMKKAVEFLLSKQRDDGGWGESYKSCETGIYTEHKETQVVNTAWAVIALMNAGYKERGPIERGIKLIMRRQQPNGEWLQEGIEGVFNKSCMISYPNYKFTFTIKALGIYARIFGNEVS